MRLVNLVMCGLTAVGAVTVALQLAYYPVVGFAMLAVLKVPRDAQLHARASLGDRMNMRLFQAWSWPVHAVHAIKR